MLIEEKTAPLAGRSKSKQSNLGDIIAKLTKTQDISFRNDLPIPPTADTSRIGLLERLQVHRRTVAAITAARGETCEAVVEDSLLPEHAVGTPAFWLLAPEIDVRSGERSGHAAAHAVAQRFNRFGAVHYVRLTHGQGLAPDDRRRLGQRSKVLVVLDDRAGAGPAAFAPRTTAWALHQLPRGEYDVLGVVTPGGDHVLFEGRLPRRDRTTRAAAVVVLASASSGERWLAAIARGALSGGKHAAR